MTVKGEFSRSISMTLRQLWFGSNVPPVRTGSEDSGLRVHIQGVCVDVSPAGADGAPVRCVDLTLELEEASSCGRSLPAATCLTL